MDTSRADWHLVFAPSKVLEYVVAHELVHLQHRSHNPEFWHTLATVFQSVEGAKDWLAHNEHGVDGTLLELLTSPLVGGSSLPLPLAITCKRRLN
jgi:hypothetical protein